MMVDKNTIIIFDTTTNFWNGHAYANTREKIRTTIIGQNSKKYVKYFN